MIHRIVVLCCLILFAALPARAEVEIQELESPSGQPFWLVQEMSIPIVAVEIGLPTGAWMDPEGKEGLAQFTVSLMNDGAGDLDAVAFANRRSDLAARFGFSAGRDGSSVSARFLVETLDESVELMALALAQPRFDPEPIARTRQQILSGIAQSQTSPGAIASRTWFARAFPDHPYGKRSGGTLESIPTITADDMADMHSRLFVRDGLKVAIVGAVDGDTAGAIVDRLIASFGEGDLPAFPQATTTPPPGVHVVTEDVPQSTAIFGHLGFDRDDPDFIAAFVMNHILAGGGFSSRMTQEVRVKRGLAYSVSAGLRPGRGASMYLGSVQTANERVSESLDVIRAEFTRMAEGDVSEEELAAAKTFLTGSFPLRFDSNGKIANYLVALQTDGFDADYINRRNGLIEAITVEDMQKAAARLLDPAALSIVVVGKPEGL